MKQKFKIAALAAKPISVELIHPNPQYNTSETNGTGIFIKLVGPHSKIFNDAKDVYDASEMTQEDSIRFFSSAIIGWDKEDFDVDYSADEAFNLLSKVENIWIVNFLSPIIRDSQNFFTIS